MKNMIIAGERFSRFVIGRTVCQKRLHIGAIDRHFKEGVLLDIEKV